jgi:signal transduction histidine kinase
MRLAGLKRLMKTTAFRLSLAYLITFLAFAGVTLVYVAWNARQLLDDQIRSTIAAEVNGLAEQYRTGNIRRLIFVIERRSREPGAFLYLLTTPQGERLAGNVTAIPPEFLERAGDREIQYNRGDEGSPHIHRALVRVDILPGGFRVLVGRDVEELDRLRSVIRRAIVWSFGLVVVLGLFGGIFIARRVLARVEAMSDTARRIMAGGFSERLPVGSAGDEFDRLASSLNAMLDRIGELMNGLREVSDNIAHDLKTPLTRLRNRAEEALRVQDPTNDRAALEATIDEADNLIRVFNALLMIARLEAGQGTQPLVPVDLGEVAREVAELYEPLVEEDGGRLALDIAPGKCTTGSRELIGQALSNLIDNALKYGRPVSGEPLDLRITVRSVDGKVELVVADRGPGIPADQRERVLERFARLEGARTRPGFGLGLSLVVAVARLHGGGVRLSDAGPGLEVAMSLPVGGCPGEGSA